MVGAAWFTLVAPSLLDVARKYDKNKPFPFKIQIHDKETYGDELRRRREDRMRMVVDSISWKREARKRIRMRFAHQVRKMQQQIKRPWYCYYFVTDYGAPEAREFLCPLTSMRARRIKESHAFFYRVYYAKCIRVSKEILDWVNDVDDYEYTFELHQYLLRFLVVNRPSQSWVERHERKACAEISSLSGRDRSLLLQ